MDEIQLKQLESCDAEQIKSILGDFNNKNAKLFNFTKLHVNDQWYKLWRAAFTVLNDGDGAETSQPSQSPTILTICLNTVRILTRDENSLQTHDVIQDLKSLLCLAGLNEPKGKLIGPSPSHPETDDNATGTATTPSVDETVVEVIVEALKCLCNLVYQSTDCRRECMRLNATDAIVRRLTSDIQYPCAVELHDMKLLFLLTTFEPSARSRVQIDLNGIPYLTEWLDEKVSDAVPPYSDELLELLCEMLKVLFTIISSPDKSPNESEIQSLHLTGVIRELLLRFGDMSGERERNVVKHAVNLLTNMSSASYIELMVKCDQEESASTSEASASVSVRQTAMPPLVYEGWNVRVLDILLRYLQITLHETEREAAASGDLIPPVLAALVQCANCHRTMRHYIRSVILPPLRDVTKRPEVGSDLRNHLCRFLTMPAMLVRDLSAELLFICCKENVARMIKYTGYGNAAGLFAKRGLLNCRQIENTAYSSDSEDSDTEEYKQVLHAVNPVVGCYEPPKRSPLEGMSEEQKEYEAMQLVNLMDQLHRSGIVQPCLIGDDGRPQPVDHILQLQEELPQQQFDQKHKT